MIELEDSNEHKNNKNKQTETAKGGAHKIPTKDDQENHRINPYKINRKASSVTELNVKAEAESSEKSGGKKGKKNQKDNRIQESKDKKKNKPTMENIPQNSKTSKISKTFKTSKSFKTFKTSKFPKNSKISNISKTSTKLKGNTTKNGKKDKKHKMAKNNKMNIRKPADKDKRVPPNKVSVLQSNNNTSNKHKNMSDKNIIKNQKRKDLTVKIATAPVQNFNGREFKSVHSVGEQLGKRNQAKENSNLAKNGSIEGKSKAQGEKSKPGKYKKSLNTSEALKEKSFNETSFQAIHIKGKDLGEGGNRLEKETGNQSLSSHRGKDYSDDEQEGTDKTVNFKEANFLSLHGNRNISSLRDKDYSDDEQEGTDKTMTFKEANFLSLHGNRSLSSHRGKDYADDEQEGTDKTVNFKKTNFLSIHSNDPDDQIMKKEPSRVTGKTDFLKKELGQDYDYGLEVGSLNVEDSNEDSKEIENFKETTFSSVH